MFYGYSLIFVLIEWLIGLGVIVAVVVFLIRRAIKHKHQTGNKSFQIAFSKEDALSQLYFLLCMAFLGVSLLAINRQMGEPFSWRTILFITSALGMYLGYKYKALFTVAISVFGLIGWWVAQGADWADFYHVKSVPVLSGFLLLSLIMYVVGHFHEQNPKWKRFSFIYLVFAIIFFSGTMFFLSTQGGIEAFGQMLQGSSIVASWEIMLMLIAFLTVLVTFFILTVGKNLMHAPENLAIVLFTLFALIILVVPGREFFENTRSYGYFDYYNNHLTSLGTFWAVVFNIGVFLEMLGIILIGYLRKESWHVTLGVVLLFILILVKYFDWFFTFLDKSLFFIGAGILMFGVGFLMEKARKKMLSSIVVPKGLPSQPPMPQTNV